MAAPISRRQLGGARIVLLFLAAYGLDYLAWGLCRLLPRLSVARAFLEPLLDACSFMLYGATFVVPFVMLVGMLKRRFGREGTASRWSFAAFAARHPVLVHRVVPSIAGALWVGEWLRWVYWQFTGEGPGEQTLPVFVAQDVAFVLGALLSGAMMVAGARFALRRLAEPPPLEATTLDEGSARADETRFAAVAVTRATRGAVGALALANAAMAAFIACSKVPPSFWLVGAFILATLGAAGLFRRVSRIVVGIDGVLVRGAGRTEFFAYADIEEVWKDGTDILLMKGARVVVRLQLVDADRARASDLVQRIRSALERSAAARGQGVDLLMRATEAEAAQSRRLASSSSGAVDYRQPAVAREQLWEVVEGPSSGKARAVAAEALLDGMDDEERARLRVAAEGCAEPRVRLALHKLLPEELLDPDDGEAPLPKRLPGRAY